MFCHPRKFASLRATSCKVSRADRLADRRQLKRHPGSVLIKQLFITTRPKFSPFFLRCFFVSPSDYGVGEERTSKGGNESGGVSSRVTSFPGLRPGQRRRRHGEAVPYQSRATNSALPSQGEDDSRVDGKSTLIRQGVSLLAFDLLLKPLIGNIGGTDG